MKFELPNQSENLKRTPDEERRELTSEELKKSRAFSKKYKKTERDALASEIMASRREESVARAEKNAEKERLKGELEELQPERDFKIESLERIRLDLEKARTGRINAVLNFFTGRVKKLIAAETELSGKLAILEKNYSEYQGVMQALEQELADRKQLELVKVRLKKFHQEQYDAYEKDLAERGVERTMERNEVVFIHGIQPYYTPEGNSPLEEWVDWKKKCEIMLAMRPMVSASSLRPGDNIDHMWSAMGFVLNKGLIDFASGRDAATVARSINTRSVNLRAGITPGEIDKAVKLRERSYSQSTVEYNEFGISTPDACGMYIYGDEYKDEKLKEIYRLPPHSEIAAFAGSCGLPVFIIKGGKLFRSRFDEERNEFKAVGEPLSAQEIKKAENPLTGDRRNKLQEGIMADSPFRLFVPEARLLEGLRTGRELYMEYEMANDRKTNEEKIMPSSEMPEKETLSSFYIPHMLVEFYKSNGVLYRKRTDSKSGKVIYESSMQKPDYAEESFSIGPYPFFDLGKPAANKSEFLAAAEFCLENELRNLASAVEEKKVNIGFFIKALGTHLYGFADQARIFGDRETAARAEAIAGKALNREELDRIIEKRTDGHGSLKLYPEDLEREFG